MYNVIWKYTLSIVENTRLVKVTAACLDRRSEKSVFRRYFIFSAEIYTLNYTIFFVYLQVKGQNLNMWCDAVGVSFFTVISKFVCGTESKIKREAHGTLILWCFHI